MVVIDGTYVDEAGQSVTEAAQEYIVSVATTSVTVDKPLGLCLWWISVAEAAAARAATRI